MRFAHPIPAAAMALTLALWSSAVLAGPAPPVEKCPSDQRLAKPQELVAPPDEGAIREVLSYADMTGWHGVGGLALRIRRITVKPGGFVPLHYHYDRPSVDFIVQGELVEHNTFCAVPIVHKAGNYLVRSAGHWRLRLAYRSLVGCGAGYRATSSATGERERLPNIGRLLVDVAERCPSPGS